MMKWVKPRAMYWVYHLAKQTELLRVLKKEIHWAGSWDGLTVRQMVDLLDWMKEMYLVEQSAGLMAMLMDAK